MSAERAVPSLGVDLEFRGLVHQVTDPSLPARLDHERVTAYIGFDPTADSLHVGSLLVVLMLRRLQEAGHRPIAVVGGATGAIGDPGGKSEERTLLSPDELAHNLAGVHAQLARFLDFGDAAGSARALLLDNGAWLNRLGVIEFLRDVGKHFSVNQMIGREAVKARLERPDQGISFTEFSYMLLQAYDYLHLFDEQGCTLQLGASDQWGNITMGIELIRRARRQEVYGLTTPLVVKADGTKFGKTESGTVWLDAARTSPYQLYQFFYRSEDSVVGTYLRYFTFLDHDTIRALDEAIAAHPERREAQRALAREVCTLVHGEAECARAETASVALYSGTLGVARRGHARRAAQGDARLDLGALRARRGRVGSGRRPRRDGARLLQARGAHPRRPGRGVRQRPQGARHRRATRTIGPALQPSPRPAQGAGLPSREFRVSGPTPPTGPGR